MVLGKALSYKTNKFSKANFGLRASVPYNNAIHIGILFSNNTPDISILAEKLKLTLRADDKQIKVLAYNHNVQIKHLPFESFSKKDISFWGDFTNQSVNNFTDKPFDFLICLDSHPGVIVRNILAKSKAKCRVGVCENIDNNQNLFELIIQNSNELDLVDSVYNYTKNIR